MPDASTTIQTSTPALDLAALAPPSHTLAVEVNGWRPSTLITPAARGFAACIDAITQTSSAKPIPAAPSSPASVPTVLAGRTPRCRSTPATVRDRLWRQYDDTHLRGRPRNGGTLKPGDEIVATALDHDANVAPWLALEEERGVVVRMAGGPVTCTLDMADLKSEIAPKTKVVAVGCVQRYWNHQ